MVTFILLNFHPFPQISDINVLMIIISQIVPYFNYQNVLKKCISDNGRITHPVESPELSVYFP
jgi:hypothetical protein